MYTLQSSKIGEGTYGSVTCRCQCYDVAQMLHGAGIFMYMWVNFSVNVGKYSIHGAFGLYGDSPLDQDGSSKYM